jgi:YggT family protein
MDAGYLTNPLIFLIDTLFSLYVFAVMLRFLFQWVQADFYNPISQFLIKITHPPLRLLRRFIPAVGRVDSSSIILMLGLQMLATYLVALLSGAAVSFGPLLVSSMSELLQLLLNIFLFAIVIRALLSWFNPSRYHPASSLLYSLTEPFLSMVRGVIPSISGIDLSPLVALIAIGFIKRLVLELMQYFMSLVA